MLKKIISTKTVYSGSTIKVAVHDVLLPDNSKIQHETVQHPGSVVIVALDSTQNVCLVQQYRVPIGQILWELPAGTLERAETPSDCAWRELQEEAGYLPGKLEDLGVFLSAPGYNNEVIHLFLATELTPSRLKQDQDEFIESTTFPFDIAIKMIDDGNIIDAKSIVGLLRVARYISIRDGKDSNKTDVSI